MFTERFIAKIRDKSCVKPALYVGTYETGESSYAESAREKSQLNKRTIDDQGTGLCMCPATPAAAVVAPVPSPVSATAVSGTVAEATAAPAQGTKVNFGQACGAAVAAVVPVPAAAPAASGDSTVAAAPTCDKPDGISGFDNETCKCDGNKKISKKKDGHYECEGSNWLPWVIGGGMLAVALALLFRNKKPKNPPEVPGVCPAGKTGVYPACVCANACAPGVAMNAESCACDIPVVVPPACPAPFVGAPPSCACPAAPSYCALPQKMYDMSTCQCTDVPQPVICPNGQAAPSNDLMNCPKCLNGSYAPVGGCPTEGGNGGNSCPQGDCNGGLPTSTSK